MTSLQKLQQLLLRPSRRKQEYGPKGPFFGSVRFSSRARDYAVPQNGHSTSSGVKNADKEVPQP